MDFRDLVSIDAGFWRGEVGIPALKRMGIQLEMKDLCQELVVDHA